MRTTEGTILRVAHGLVRAALGGAALLLLTGSAVADPILSVRADSGVVASANGSSLPAGTTQAFGRAFAGDVSGDAFVVAGLAGDPCAFILCGSTGPYAASFTEVDATGSGALRSYARAGEGTDGRAAAGWVDSLVFSPRAGFGADVHIELDLDVLVSNDILGLGSAAGRFYVGVTDGTGFTDAAADAIFMFERSRLAGSDTECSANPLDASFYLLETSDGSCTSDGRYTLVLPGLADGISREFYFLLAVEAGCPDIFGCAAVANGADTAYMKVLNPFTSSHGYAYVGAPTGPGPGPDTIPEPGLAVLVAGGACAAFLRRPRGARRVG